MLTNSMKRNSLSSAYLVDALMFIAFVFCNINVPYCLYVSTYGVCIRYAYFDPDMSDPGTVLKVLKKEYAGAKYYLDFRNPLQLVVAAILSPQVRDEVVNAATPKLFKKYRTAKDFASAKESELIEYISDISFAGNKARYIIEACKKIVEEYDGKVPDTCEDLTKLKGVGQKTAMAILQNAFGKTVGIPVDTHVLRVSYRLGWTSHKNSDKVMKDLMNEFPKKEWERIPHILKAHGRKVCRAPVPVCSKCPVEKFCPKKGVKKS